MSKIMPLVAIASTYRDTNAAVLKTIRELSDKQLHW
jgi:hypothetical protein